MLTVIRTRHYSERKFYLTLQCFARHKSQSRNYGRSAGHAGASTLYEILQRHRNAD